HDQKLQIEFATLQFEFEFALCNLQFSICITYPRESSPLSPAGRGNRRMTGPPLRWRRLCVPKRGHRPEEYEDAAAGDGRSGRFAVADGATESAFAGDWSRLLAEAFVRDSVLVKGWPNWLPEVRNRWLEAVGKRDLPWYLEEKFAQGAFATLLG